MPSQTREVIYRHPLLVRAARWINVLCVLVLLMSGMATFASAGVSNKE